ncbi:MAG: M28 family peptidase [Acidobacteria bacterium]|nr:M28 family peptidase [Acidobacteriota bacterium]
MSIFRNYKLWLALVVLGVAVSGQIAIGKRSEPSSSEPSSKYFDAGRLIDDVRFLASDELEGRSPERPSIAKARDHVAKRMREVGIEPERQEFKFMPRRGKEELTGVNFIGRIEGRSKEKAGKYIVITAHYDHVGIQNGQIYNGADDNASGTAALFAIASYFKKNRPEHSLIFVALDAEEMGLQGARHFVANLPVAKDAILLNVNMDMLSRSEKGELYAAGTYHYPQFKPALEAVQKKARVKLLLGHDRPELGRDDWTFQSDHGAFHREKIPFIYFGVEDHPDYHRPTDDFEKIDQAFYIKAVETVVESLRALDKS